MSHPADGDAEIDRSPDSPTSTANLATQFVVHALCTEGYAIVAAETAETADEIERSTAPYVKMSGFTRWREFRSADLPIEVVREVVETEIGDLEEYLVAIELTNDVTSAGDQVADRWIAVQGLVFVGNDEYPADDDEFTWEWGCGDPELEVDILHQDAMLADFPWEIIERFDLAECTTLDGDLGRVGSDNLDAVVAALQVLGHSVA